MAKARFKTETRVEKEPVERTIQVTKCEECGWETTALNTTLYGPPNALDLALLAHRIDHLEEDSLKS